MVLTHQKLGTITTTTTQLNPTPVGSGEGVCTQTLPLFESREAVSKRPPAQPFGCIQNVGTHYERWSAGVLGPVTLSGLNKGTKDLTKHKWSYKVGLKGELVSLNTIMGSSSVDWDASSLAIKKPVTWYKAKFNEPKGNDPLALDMSNMGKGQIWINGKGLGRHWPAYTARGSCGGCSYAGTYSETKCQTNCGQPSQRWYHIPRSWLRPTGNLVVVFEEWGGDPTKISLLRRTY